MRYLNKFHYESMSSAIITKKLNQRITVDIIFKDNNEECIKLFRSINKRYWDSEKKVWSFPCEALPTIVAGLKANGVILFFNNLNFWLVVVYYNVGSEYSLCPS